MSSINRKITIALIILLIYAGISYRFKHNMGPPEGASNNFSNWIPHRIDNWYGYDLSLEDRFSAILETKDIIHRNYSSEVGKQVLLSIVHYNDSKVDFHAPESCLGGLGQNVDKRLKEFKGNLNGSVRSLKVVELFSKTNNQRLLSYYFYKTGNFYDYSYLGIRLKIAYNKLFKDSVSASLIRITTDVVSSKTEAQGILDSYLGDLLPVVKNMP